MGEINKIVYKEMYKIALYIEPYAKIFSIYKAIERFSTIPWQLIDLYPKDEDIIDKLHKIIGYYSLLCNIYHLLYFKKEPRVSLKKINGPFYKFPLYYRQKEIDGKPLHKYLVEKIFNNKYEAESRKKFRGDACYDEIVSYKFSIDNKEEALNKIEKSLLIDYERLFPIPINPFDNNLSSIILYTKEEKSEEEKSDLRDFFDKNLLWNNVLKDSIKKVFSSNLFISYGILSEMRYRGIRKEEQESIQKYFEGIVIINIEIKEKEIEKIMGNLYNEIKGRVKEKKNGEMWTNTAITLGINQFEEPCLMIEPICQLKITESLNIPIFLIYIAVMPGRVSLRLTKTIDEIREGINVKNQKYLQRFCIMEKLI